MVEREFVISGDQRLGSIVIEQYAALRHVLRQKVDRAESGAQQLRAQRGSAVLTHFERGAAAPVKREILRESRARHPRGG